MKIILPRIEQLRFKFEPHDLWVGVYWAMKDNSRMRDIDGHWWWEIFHVYITIIPMLPLFIEVWFPLDNGT